MRRYLASVNWDEKLKNKSVNEAWKSFKTVLKNATDMFVPYSTAKDEEQPK